VGSGLVRRVLAVGAVALGAVGVQAERVVGDDKAFGQGHRMLAFLDFGVVKLFHLPAIEADQVVVVLALVEFKDRFAALKLAALEDAGLLELRQHPIDSGQPDVGPLLQQHPKNVLGRHVSLRAALENLQDFQARHRGFEAGVFEFVDVGHAQCWGPKAAQTGQKVRGYNEMILLPHDLHDI